jgi:hypothetical protein
MRASFDPDSASVQRFGETTPRSKAVHHKVHEALCTCFAIPSALLGTFGERVLASAGGFSAGGWRAKITFVLFIVGFVVKSSCASSANPLR